MRIIIWTGLHSLHSIFGSLSSLDAPYQRNFDLHCMDEEAGPEKLSNSPKVALDSNPGLFGPNPKCFPLNLASSPARGFPEDRAHLLWLRPPKYLPLSVCVNRQKVSRDAPGFLETCYGPRSLHSFSLIFMMDSVSWDLFSPITDAETKAQRCASSGVRGGEEELRFKPHSCMNPCTKVSLHGQEAGGPGNRDATVGGGGEAGQGQLCAKALFGLDLCLGSGLGPAKCLWVTAQLASPLCHWSPLSNELPCWPSFGFFKHRRTSGQPTGACCPL